MIYYEPFDYIFDDYGYPRGEGRDYYHRWVPIDGIRRSTEKAVLIEMNGVPMWVPKSIIRDTSEHGTNILVHGGVFAKILINALHERGDLNEENKFDSDGNTIDQPTCE